MASTPATASASASAPASSTASRKRSSHPPLAASSCSSLSEAASTEQLNSAGDGIGGGVGPGGGAAASAASSGAGLVNNNVNKKPLIGDNNNVGGYEAVVHLKILIPSVAAGSIIGKGGETIAELQKTSGGRIKMSKAHDFYPGTNERVCLISGALEAVVHILEFINEKIREKPDPHARPAIDFDSKTSAEREKQVKPNIASSI